MNEVVTLTLELGVGRDRVVSLVPILPRPGGIRDDGCLGPSRRTGVGDRSGPGPLHALVVTQGPSSVCGPRLSKVQETVPMSDVEGTLGSPQRHHLSNWSPVTPLLVMDGVKCPFF